MRKYFGAAVVFSAVLLLFFGSCKNAASGGASALPGTADMVITFARITDDAPFITGPVLYLVSNNGPTTATVTVEAPLQYDHISWRVNSTAVTGSGPSFTLDAADPAYAFFGGHFLAVLVMKGGEPYSKTVSFRIEY